MTHSTERRDGWIYMTHKPDPSDWDYEPIKRKAMSNEQDPEATSHVTNQDWTQHDAETDAAEEINVVGVNDPGLEDPNRWIAEPLEITRDIAHADLVEVGDPAITAAEEAAKIEADDEYQAALLTRGGGSRILSRREEDVARIVKLEEQVFALTARVDQFEEAIRLNTACVSTNLARTRTTLDKVERIEQRISTIESNLLPHNGDLPLHDRIADHDNEITELKDGLAYLRRVVIGTMPGK